MKIVNPLYDLSFKYLMQNNRIAPEEFNDIANYLGTVVQDDDFRNQLKGEDEIDEIFRNQEAELANTKQREAEERRLKEEAIQQKKAMQIQFAKHLLQQNTSVAEISKMTDLDEKTISEL
jgi:uncharacterized protein YecA (UPF0149 family)